MPDGTASAHRFLPKLVTSLREGYGFVSLRKDVLAGLTVAIVALPLSMAIAVASGVPPERGLYAAIVGGALVSLLSGSRFQIGGPAGAFIVLVNATVMQFGLDGLLLTVLLSGFMLTLIGASRLGSLIRHVPHAVTVGFTCGIAVTILASQVRDFFGLTLSAPEPGHLFPKLAVLAAAAGTTNPSALATGTAAVVIIVLFRRLLPKWPGMLFAVAAASIAALMLEWPVETIGARFGELPRGLPTPQLPRFDMELLRGVLPHALSFTLLGGVESLLSAKVADAMTGRKHRSNMELVAQGLANIGSALFGGISVTGTIARTATNVRAGATSPVSGILHAAFLLLFLAAAGPLAAYVPLATLAGVLVVVCWNMAEKGEFAKILSGRRDAPVLLATFGLTLAIDLTWGIVGGCVLAAAMTLYRRWGQPA